IASSTYLKSLIYLRFGTSGPTFSDPAGMLPTSKRQATVVSVTADAVRSARLLLETPSPADSAVRALAGGRVPALPRVGPTREVRHRAVPPLPRDHDLRGCPLSHRGAAAGEPLAAR